MALFAVISVGENERLADAVKREFSDSSFRIGPGQYFVSATKLTTKDVATRLGTSGGKVGRVLVMNVVNQTGWHSKDMWEWIATQNAVSDDADL